MPERANSLASAVLAGALAAAALLGLNPVAFAAAECLESPDLKMARAGHWYYHLDRTQNRKCWYFEPAEAAASAPAAAAPPAPATPAAEDASQSVLSRFAAGLSQAFAAPPQSQAQAPQPQQYDTENADQTAQQATAPKPAKPPKTARRERPSTAAQSQFPSPTTSGAAPLYDEGRNQTKQVIDKADNHDSPADVAEREALFQDFVRWQMNRNLFGRP